MPKNIQDTRLPAISFEKRRIRAVVTSVSDTLIYVQLSEVVMQRCFAKIDASHLIQKIDAYHVGHRIDIFITKPVKNTHDTWFAREDWFDSNRNPWLVSLPSINATVTGTAEIYVDDYGVIVELDEPHKGISAFLHVSELNSDLIAVAHNIRDLVHIGDRVKAKVMGIDTLRLHLQVSIAALIEEQKKTDKNTFDSHVYKGSVTQISEPISANTQHDLEGLHILVIDDDERYASSLSDLLKLSGAKAFYACNESAIFKQFNAFKENKSQITHAIIDFAIETISAKDYESILRHIKELKIKCLVVSGNVQRAYEFSKQHGLVFLAKHEPYIDIVTWLKTDKAPEPDLAEKPDAHWCYRRKLNTIDERAENYLQTLSDDIDANAAILVTQIRSGVFEIRINHQAIVDSPRMEGELINSAITSALETKRPIARGLHDKDPLKPLAPLNARFFLVMPFEAEQDKPRILIFFGQKPFSEKEIKKVKFSLHELKHLIELNHLTGYIEELEPFADIGRLTAGMLHEIRNEIAPIFSAAEKMERIKQFGNAGAFSDPQALIENSWQNISASLERIAALATGGLNNLRMQKPDYFELNQLVARICRYMEDSVKKSTQLIMFEPYPQDIQLYLQHHAIEQPLINVIQNAIQHCESKSHPIIGVRIRYCTSHPFRINGKDYPLCIDVADNGSGMNADQQASAFVPGKSSKAEGSGLGLYVSRNLLHALGGELEIIETWRWLGSTFRLFIPMSLGE